jgi:nitrogenase iron protein NifH
MATRQIAFYGHKGVGTTTVVVNVAAALAEAGLRVIVVGCDGEPNATAVLHPRQSVLPLVESGAKSAAKGHDYVISGFKGVRSIEFGRVRSPEAFAVASERLHDLLAVEGPSADCILYDITGDVQQCLVPLAREGLFAEVLAITSAQVAALKSVNHLLRLKELGILPQTLRLLGLVGNALPSTYAEAVVDDFSRKTAQKVIVYIPRSLVVYRCEFFGETLIDAAPLAHHTYLYRKLAKALVAGLPGLTPVPLSAEEFEDWSRNWGDRLYDLGEGLIEIGSGI